MKALLKSAVSRSTFLRSSLGRRAHIDYYSHGLAGRDGALLQSVLDSLIGSRSVVPFGDKPSGDASSATLSFDDGFSSCFWIGQEIERRGGTACFFLNVAGIGLTDSDDIASVYGSRQPERPLNWDEVEKLVSAGHTIGSHAMTHHRLSEYSVERIVDEVGRSRNELVGRLGMCDHFAWPFGTWSDFPVEAVAPVCGLGFRTLSSATRGWNRSRRHADELIDPSSLIERETFQWEDPVDLTLGLVGLSSLVRSPR